jgi:outer membrane protein insertion porin family
MRLKSEKLLIILFILMIPVISLSAAEWYTDKTIEEIRFSGLKNISESELESITSEYIGKTFTDDTFWDLQGKLYALDYFDDLLPNALPGNSGLSKFDPENTVIIEFNVVERAVVKKIRISGNKNIRKNQILDVVLLKPGDIINNTKIKLDEDSIKTLYVEKGFPDITVTGEQKEKNEDYEAEIVFTIEEGEQTKIQEIRFSGNSFVFQKGFILNPRLKRIPRILKNTTVIKDTLMQKLQM